MKPIFYIDRKDHKLHEEKVYGAQFIQLLYGKTLSSKLFGTPLAYLLAHIPLFSFLYGWLQKQKISQKKIEPFIKTFNVDMTPFAKKPSEFTSFNDFFTRRLKNPSQEIDRDPLTAVIPAEGRYLFYQDIEKADGFIVKGKKFTLEKLLNNAALAKSYKGGSMVIARLCPTDYHRYHFPSDCTPSCPLLINGWLYSVNPAALKKNIEIFTENKRVLNVLKTPYFDEVLFLEIGATCVGSIHETSKPHQFYKKGEEKGYFSFGASSLILLFKKNIILFDNDLLEASKAHIEIKCLMGQSIGKAYKN